MKHYDYQKQMRVLWDHAVKTYQSGDREPSGYFSKKQLKWMDANGLKVMDLYDFAEDFVSGDEPDFDTFLMISEARRDYFLHIQEGVKSTEILDPETIPAKTDEVDGIEWLPRILPKAKAKLRGELPPEIMYCCGGDRSFLKKCNLHPAEFLRVVWAHIDDDAATIAWVKSRKGS